MIGWLIGLGVLVFLLLLLLTPVILRLEYDDTRALFLWKISWLGISWFSSDEKGLLQRKKRKPQKKTKPKEEHESGSSKEKWKRYWYLFQDTVSILPKPLRLLWKGISIRGLTVGIRIGRFDAKDCVTAYGAVNALLYTALGLLQSMMRIQVKQTQVKCIFGSDQIDWIIRGRGHVCPLAALAALMSFAVGMAMRRNQNAPKKQKKVEQAALNMQEGKSGFPDAELT